MLTHHRKQVCLFLMAYDMPLWSVVETDATLYQKDTQRFHILLTEPVVQDFQDSCPLQVPGLEVPQTPRLLWFEISPSQLVMTMQGNGLFSYRHFWERGFYGLSRYWLQNDLLSNAQIALRNYTRLLELECQTIAHEILPCHVRVEYELWSEKVQLGHYVLNLEIQH